MVVKWRRPAILSTQHLDRSEHFISARKIVLKNVPHFYCNACGTASYGEDVRISDLVRYAYAEEMNEIQYNN